MDKVVKGIGWLTILYIGLYILDCIVIDTKLDTRLKRIIKTIIKTTNHSETKHTTETNEIEMGFH